MKTKILLKFLHHTFLKVSHRRNQHDAGFSFTDLVIVFLIIGVLSAIAAPAWNALITRQRIRSVNSQVLQALQKGQSQAKFKKENVTVEFISTEDPPEVKIDGIQQSLNSNGEIKAGMIKLATGICDTDCTGFTDSADSIIFNYLGTVESTQTGTVESTELPFAITVSTPEGELKRCVIVETIIGGMRIAEGGSCPF